MLLYFISVLGILYHDFQIFSPEASTIQARFPRTFGAILGSFYFHHWWSLITVSYKRILRVHIDMVHMISKMVTDNGMYTTYVI